MTREQIRQEAEESVNRCTPYHTGSFIQGYIAGAENREEKIADLKANFDYILEGKDVEIMELKEKLEIVWFANHDSNIKLLKAKKMIKDLYEGLDKLYLSGLSAKKIAFIERLQDKAEQFLKEIEK